MKAHIRLKMNGITLSMEIDTCAGISCIDRRAWIRLGKQQ